MAKRLTPEHTTRREAERQAHIDAVVASAPTPSPEQIEEIARLLLPSLLRQAEERMKGAPPPPN